MMTSFIPFLIVSSLYELFIEGMEYDDTFHTSAHCKIICKAPSDFIPGVVIWYQFTWMSSRA